MPSPTPLSYAAKKVRLFAGANNTPDLLDESMNYLYYASMFTGVFGAVGAWAASLGNRRRIKELQARVERLPALLEEAKTQPTDQLAAARKELDQLSDWFADKFVADQIPAEVFNTARTRVAHVRELVERRLCADVGPPGRVVPGNDTTHTV